MKTAYFRLKNGSTGVEETPVLQYADVTRGAHGAVDLWGNVWEWTSTVRTNDDAQILAVKGGAWDSDRTDCRTEYRGEGRDASMGYENVGFRVILVQEGKEPTQSPDLVSLSNPDPVLKTALTHSVTLSWNAVDGAVAYQLFEYDRQTGLWTMLQLTTSTSLTVDSLDENTTYYFAVQAISYTAVGEFSVDDCIGATTLKISS